MRTGKLSRNVGLAIVILGLLPVLAKAGDGPEVICATAVPTRVKEVSTGLETEPEDRERVWNLPRKSYGYIDESGKVVIAPQFEEARAFNRGYGECWMYSEKVPYWPDPHKIIYVDKSGNQLVRIPEAAIVNHKAYDEFQAEGKTILRDNFIRVLSTRGSYKLLKRFYDYVICDGDLNILASLPNSWLIKGENPKTGNQWCKIGNQAFEFTGARGKSQMPGFEPVPTPTEFDKIYRYFSGFREGLAAVMDAKKHWSYIDADGHIKIKLPDDCSNAQNFSEGLAAIAVGGKPWQSHMIHGVSELSPREDAKFGYINKSGKFVIPPVFSCPRSFPISCSVEEGEFSFKNGLAKVTGTRFGDITEGVINREGKFVIPPVYVSISPFSEGLAVFDAGPVGFSPSIWARAHKNGPLSGNCPGQCVKFLGQYAVIGMPQCAVESLLGEALPMQGLQCYCIASNCLGQYMFALRYENGKVDGYAFISGYGEKDPIFITNNTPKPNVYENFSLFLERYGRRSSAAK
jgi:WG containing repeat